MKRLTSKQGFTLIELLLVVLIIGLMLAVIVPRAWRANIDAKYGLVRQNCSSLASHGQTWAEEQMEASVEYSSTAMLYNYLKSLTGASDGTPPGSMWVAAQRNNNWLINQTNIPIIGRWQNNVDDQPPEASVEDIVPPEKIPRNPFNGASVFVRANDPDTVTNVVPGAIACGVAEDESRPGGWAYFAFVFQGTDSTDYQLNQNDITSFHAGMESQDIVGLRNGIFFGRTTIFAAP